MCSACQQLLPFSPSPPAVIFKLTHMQTYRHTTHWHTQTDRCQCVSPIFKCLDITQKDRVGQMLLSWHSILHLSAAPTSEYFCRICFLLLSVLLFLQWSPFRFFLPTTISYWFLFLTPPHSLAVYSLWSNPESQWILRLMQRIREELGIQLEKIRLLSFQADI